jgi:2',3'-cyclic-nucleotide 2'-phosphodiesterase (5'-nucleotidase family)
MRKLLALTASVLALSTTAFADVSFKLLLTNDIYEYKGYAGVAAVTAAARAESENVFLIHAGDTFSPSLLAGLDKGQHIVDLINMIKPDFFTLGNHEFDFGPEVAFKHFANMDTTHLTANMTDANGNAIDGIGARSIVDLGEIKLGFFGVTSEDAAVKSSVGDLKFSDALAAAEAQAAALKEEGADMIIAIAHTDISDDFALLRMGVADIILSADDHNQMTFFDGNTAMMESGEDGDVVMEMSVTTKKDDRGRTRWSHSIAIHNPGDFAVPADVAAKVAELDGELDAKLGTVIGKTSVELNTTRPFIRQQETTFGNMLADAMRAATGADVALTNGGGIRAKKVYAPGTEITSGDILAELPFGNKTIIIEQTGAQLVAALENGVSDHENVNGRWPHISGMSMTVDLAAAPGARVSNVMVGGAPVDLNKTYSLATNDFLGRGGDGYSTFAGAKQLLDANQAVLMASQLMNYIADMGTVSPAVDGRVSMK